MEMLGVRYPLKSALCWPCTPVLSHTGQQAGPAPPQDPQGLMCSASGRRKKEVVRWDFLPHTTVCLRRKHVEQLCAVGRETEAGNSKVELAGYDSFV